MTHVAIAECITDVLFSHFNVLCDRLLNRRMATRNLFVLYNKEQTMQESFFNFKIFQQTSKAGAALTNTNLMAI